MARGVGDDGKKAGRIGVLSEERIGERTIGEREAEAAWAKLRLRRTDQIVDRPTCVAGDSGLRRLNPDDRDAIRFARDACDGVKPIQTGLALGREFALRLKFRPCAPPSPVHCGLRVTRDHRHTESQEENELHRRFPNVMSNRIIGGCAYVRHYHLTEPIGPESRPYQLSESEAPRKQPELSAKVGLGVANALSVATFAAGGALRKAGRHGARPALDKGSSNAHQSFFLLIDAFRFRIRRAQNRQDGASA